MAKNLMMKKKVLVTGGVGFIGSNLCRELYKKGYGITVLDNLAPQIHGDQPFKSELYLQVKDLVNFVRGDIRDQQLLNQLVGEHEYIVHLAAETGTGQSMYQIAHYTDVNVLGTARLLDAVGEYRSTIKKMVVASSRAIYGEGKYKKRNGEVVYPTSRNEEQLKSGDFQLRDEITGEILQSLPTSEDSMIRPASVYGVTKQVQEQLVMLTCQTLGIPAVSLRFQNVYGPGQSLKNPYTGILSIFSTRIQNGKAINIFEDGFESRDFVYITDVVNSIILSLECKEADGRVFNVGSGIPITVKEVADTLIKAFNSNVDCDISGNYRVGDIRHNYADLSQINSRLNFKPHISFLEGIEKFVLWVKSQPIEKDLYEDSLKELQEKGLYK